MTKDDLELDLEELSSAEDFLDYFGVSYEPSVVQVNRLHILQRFHDYLAGADAQSDADAIFRTYRELLTGAYQDFVKSDAQTEKVFRVFRMSEPQTAFVPITSIGRIAADA